MTSRFTPRRLRDPFQPPAAAAAYCRLPTRHPVPACPAAPSGLPGEGPEPEPGDPCAGPGAQQDYDLPLHLAAVVVLLGVSLAGSLGPVALHLSSASSAVSTAIRLGTFFGELLRLGRPCRRPGAGGRPGVGRLVMVGRRLGIRWQEMRPSLNTSWPTIPSPARPPLPRAGFGTILSTSFIHMLLPAAQSFASPCLPRAWADSFDGWAYLFVTLAVLLMHLIDFLLKAGWAGLDWAGLDGWAGGWMAGRGWMQRLACLPLLPPLPLPHWLPHQGRLTHQWLVHHALARPT